MTESVTIMRCAMCKRPFSYIPRAEDHCRPDAPNLICNACYEQAIADDKRDEVLAEYYSREVEASAAAPAFLNEGV